MLNANEILLEDKLKDDNEEDSKAKFSFKWLACLIIARQDQGKDTIIVVIGDRRNGKSNWMLRLITAFIKEKRKADPNFKWSWNGNFALTRPEASKKAEQVADRSFMVYDEGADIAYRSDTLSMMNKNLIKFMNKSGKKCLLTLIVLPDIYQLDPKILNMAHLMVAVPYRYKKVCAFGFIYGRNPNPLVTDKFGLERIKRQFNSKRMSATVQMASMDGRVKVMHDKEFINIPYPKQMFKFLVSLPTFLYSHRFISAYKSFEDRYIKNVKDKQLMAHETEDKFINISKFNNIKKKYEVLLYNVYRYKTDADGKKMSYNQLASLHTDEKGNIIINKDLLSRIINMQKNVFGEYDAG